jgi:hypothetical protein
MYVEQGQHSTVPEDEDDRGALVPEAQQVVLARALNAERTKESPQYESAGEAQHGGPGLTQLGFHVFSRRSTASAATRDDAPGSPSAARIP